MKLSNIIAVLAAALWIAVGLIAIRFGMPSPQNEAAGIIMITLMIGVVFSGYFILTGAFWYVERVLGRRRRRER